MSNDGKHLLFDLDNRQTLQDVWVLPLFGERKPFPFVATPYDESHGRFSPDGKWVAYTSTESGKREVYVRPFPDADAGKWQISTAGGMDPLAARAQTFSMAYEKLASSWKIVYENFGVDNNKSITELSVHANPLNQMVIQKFLPSIEKDEQLRMEAARSNFYKVSRLTDRMTICIFAVSIFAVIGLAYNLRHHLNVKTA